MKKQSRIHNFLMCIKRQLYEIYVQKKTYIFIVMFLNTVTVPALYIVQMLIPKIAFDNINMQNGFMHTITLLFICLCAERILTCINSLFKHIFDATFLTVRTNEMSKFHRFFLTIPYRFLENSAFNDNARAAYSALTGFDGYQAGLHAFTNILAGFSSILLLLYFFYKISSFIVFFCLFTTALSVFIGMRYIAFDGIAEKERANPLRLKNYFNKLCFDYRYGKEIRIFSLLITILKYYNKAAEAYMRVLKRSERFHLKLSFGDGILYCIRDIVCFSVIVYAFDSKRISIGDMVFYLGLLASFSFSSQILITEFKNFIKACTKIHTYYSFINTRYRQKQTAALKPDFEFKSLKFENVSFAYKKGAKNVLHNINFEIRQGSKVGIVGKNGAGKSTIIKLLLRLYKPVSGRITLNGIDIDNYVFDEYIKILSVVFQDIHIFAASVLENITCSDNADKEKLDTIIAIARLNDFISNTPNGIHTQLRKEIDDDGIIPSGGQSQKISFCRTLYKNAELYIFDEATAALDGLAEKNFVHSYYDFTKNKTSVFISHRLFYMKNMDNILVIHNGSLIEEGNHNKLMKAKGVYYSLFNKQAEYFGRENENK